MREQGDDVRAVGGVGGGTMTEHGGAGSRGGDMT